MDHTTKGDRSPRPIGAASNVWRGDSLRRDIQAQTQDRIGVGLRAMYAETLQQPLSPQLEALVRRIEMGWETSQYDC